MKIAIALRTCTSVFNYWNDTRIVDCPKSTVTLTCLNSLLASMALSNHEFIFSIHDDNSDAQSINKFGQLSQHYNITGELINCPKRGNFISQYEWCKTQDVDYIYCVEDDYLHQLHAITDMMDMIKYLKDFNPGDYAIFPFNCPHRYTPFQSLYPSYIVQGPKQFWRSAFNSTHTFFVSKACFNRNDDIMQYQAYNWHVNGAFEDTSINKIWKEQNTMLFTPLESLAIHIANSSQEEPFLNWQELWNQNQVSVE